MPLFEEILADAIAGAVVVVPGVGVVRIREDVAAISRPTLSRNESQVGLELL